MVTDKQKHIFASFVISLLVGFFFLIFTNGLTLFLISFICGMSAGFGKEYADYVYYKWDWYDILANFIGSIFGASLITVIAILI